MSFYSALDKASLEALSSDPSSPGNGRIYLNTTTGPKWYFGGLWRTALDQGSSQSMSNKTSTNLRISDYVEFAETSAPSTPSAGYSRVYFKTDGKAYKKNSAGVETDLVEGTSGSGSGEINVIENPSAASATTGWTAGTSHTVTRDTSNSPLASVISTCFAVSSSAAVSLGSQTNTSGVYDSITMPSGLRSKKLKFEFYMTTPAASDGTWAIAVYEGSTRLALSTDSSGDTILPSGVTGKFTTYFDTSTASGYSVHFVQRTYTSANTLYVTNVIVGPGIQPQGAVVTGPQSFTPEFVSNALGTLSATTATFERINERMFASGTFTAGTVTGSNANLSLPNSLTAASTSANGLVIGRWQRANLSASTRKMGNIFVIGGNNFVYFASDDQSAASSPFVATAANGLFANGDVISFEFSLGISEWAGSGTVNLAQNDVEYASNSSTSTTTSDSTSFAHGPSGSQIQNITADITRRVRFNNIQANDTFIFEISADRSQWFPVINGGVTFSGVVNVEPYTLQGSNSYGIGRMQRVTGSTTDIDIRFGQYISFGATYGAAGSSYGATFGAYYWRVRKISGGQVVGYGAATESTLGLLQPVTSMSDSLATTLGLKQYIHGTTYNGGNAPTVSGTGATILRGVFIPYKTQDGTWRLRFNLGLTLSSSTRTTYSFNIAGITTKNLTDYHQAVSVCSPPGAATNAYQGWLLQNSNQVDIYHASFTTAGYLVSGDIELNAKPTWAY